MIITPNTEVRLLSDVPLNNSYEHQMTFPSKEAQSSFFYSKVTKSFTDFTYQREDTSIKVPGGRDSLYSCNYVMYRNSDFSTKWFYGFITKLEYINPEMTKVYFEIDVYQTWMFDLSFKPSFIERQHCKRWNSDGTPVLNTVDEGLNYGTDYKTTSVTRFIPYTDVFFLVIVCTQTMHGGSADPKEIKPMLNGSPQPLTYYVHPFKMDGTSPGVSVGGTPYEGLSTVTEVLKGLYKQTGAVNNIASIYVTEFIGWAFTSSLDFPSVNFDPVTIQDDTDTFNTLYVKSLSAYGTMTANMGNKYVGYTNVEESKLFMHPYTVTILSDLKGNHQEIKNEYIQDSNLQIKVRGSLGTSNKVSYHVDNYLIDSTVDHKDQVSLERSILNNSPNDVPVITDLLAAYLQGNRNTIENQKSSILFGQVMTTIGGSLGTVMQSKMMGGLGAAQGMSETLQNVGGGYFQMAGLMAKQKDINNQPAQLTKMGGNTAYDYGNDIKGLYIIKKEITDEYRKKLSDYFKMFGYKVNELLTPNLNTRQHFNFIKTIGANITGNIPGDDLVRLKNIFDTGVTLWHGDWVGDYTKVNGEV